jgi:hypothetical protein
VILPIPRHSPNLTKSRTAYTRRNPSPPIKQVVNYVPRVHIHLDWSINRTLERPSGFRAHSDISHNYPSARIPMSPLFSSNVMLLQGGSLQVLKHLSSLKLGPRNCLQITLRAPYQITNLQHKTSSFTQICHLPLPEMEPTLQSTNLQDICSLPWVQKMIH